MPTVIQIVLSKPFCHNTSICLPISVRCYCHNCKKNLKCYDNLPYTLEMYYYLFRYNDGLEDIIIYKKNKTN